MSATLRISALAQQMRAEGRDVLDFAAGQPDFPTPEAAAAAGIAAIEQGKTRYTANPGTPELRASIAEWYGTARGLDYKPEQILVSPGAKASLFFAGMALLDPGDQVLVPSPHWVSYPEQIALAEAEAVFVTCREENGFKLDPGDLKRAVTPRTRVLLLNYPSNPTGVCYTRAELEPLAELVLANDLWVITDEIYSRLLFDGRSFTSFAGLGKELHDRTLIIDGASKTFAMTGWRIGWTAGPPEVIAGMSKLQSHTTSNATSISQWATLGALGVPESTLASRVEEFQTRRDEIIRRLRGLSGVTCVEPGGAFYAFPNVSGLFNDKLKCGGDVAQYLLDTAEVAVVPGEAFGSPDHLRLSYALSIDRVREGMDRIERALLAAASR